MKIRIGILEDEKPFVEELKSVIRMWASEKECLAEIKDYQTSESFFLDIKSGETFDLLFLDIMLPSGQNGMEVAERIRLKDEHTIIIFLSSNVEYIADGYDVDALNFLLKPIRYPKIKKCLDKAYDILTNKNKFAYLLKNKNMETLISYHDILYFTNISQHMEIHTKQNTYKEWKRLSNVEHELPLEFVRCHRSFIINIGAVRSIHPKSIILINNETIPIGESYLTQVKEKWMYFYR